MEQKQKILVVDDNEENLSVLGNQLISKGYQVLFAESGEIALKAVERKQPDLILLDVSMPGMSGYEVCERLKAKSETAHIPVIFLTAHAETQDIVKGFSLGAIDYVTKPFNKQELLSRVQTHLELKHARKQLELQNNELKENLSTKNKFFSIIAHDLKNPFNSLLGLSKIMSESIEQKDWDQVKEIAGYINQTTQQSYKLLTNLLEWSRLQMGNIQFNPTKFSLKQLIDETVQLNEASYSEKRITVTTDVEETLELTADWQMLQAIVRNLLSNAIKFTKQGQAVYISATRNNNTVEISIKDKGIGIAEKDIEKLFKIESGFSRRGTNNEKGTGLGLLLCKEFVEKHNGKIWVESEVGKGSDFKFTIIEEQ